MRDQVVAGIRRDMIADGPCSIGGCLVIRIVRSDVALLLIAVVLAGGCPSVLTNGTSNGTPIATGVYIGNYLSPGVCGESESTDGVQPSHSFEVQQNGSILLDGVFVVVGARSFIADGAIQVTVTDVLLSRTSIIIFRELEGTTLTGGTGRTIEIYEPDGPDAVKLTFLSRYQASADAVCEGMMAAPVLYR